MFLPGEMFLERSDPGSARSLKISGRDSAIKAGQPSTSIDLGERKR